MSGAAFKIEFLTALPQQTQQWVYCYINTQVSLFLMEHNYRILENTPVAMHFDPVFVFKTPDPTAKHTSSLVETEFLSISTLEPDFFGKRVCQENKGAKWNEWKCVKVLFWAQQVADEIEKDNKGTLPDTKFVTDHC